MDFDNWTKRNIDVERQRRLMVGYLIGLVTVGSLGTALAFSTDPVEEEAAAEEDVMDVKLEAEPEPEPEPEAEPEPEPEAATPPEQMLRGPVMPSIETPTEIPEDAPKESDADSSNPYASGDPFQYAGQGGTGRVAAKKVVVAAPVEAAAPAAPKGPERVTAGTIPPKVLSGGNASYPAAAKAAGIEGVVIVKFVVSIDGNPEDVQVVRGPEALREACESAVRNSKYSPAMRDGQPVSVIKTKKCTFKLTT